MVDATTVHPSGVRMVQVDLPNQTRILGVGDNYRVMVGGSLVDDLPDVTIVRTDPGRYYALRVIG